MNQDPKGASATGAPLFCVEVPQVFQPDDIYKFERHCPRLGHVVRFDYCRTGGDSQAPCFKSLDCWWERFDVVGHFRHALPEAEFNRLARSRPPEKVASLVDLIHQARKRTLKNSEST